MTSVSGSEILLTFINIALASFAIMAAMGIILITRAQLARSWFLIGIAVMFFVIKEIGSLLTSLGLFKAGTLTATAEFLFILLLVVGVFYQYKTIRDISKKVQ